MASISWKRAKALTHALAVNKDLPWGANSDHCSIKRECALGVLMTDFEVPIEALGRITVVFEDPSHYLHNCNLLSEKKLPNGRTDWQGRIHPDEGGRWRYHTALTIDVKNPGTGEVVPMVIEPSMDPREPMTQRDFLERVTMHSDMGKVCLYTQRLGQDISDIVEYDPVSWQGASVKRDKNQARKWATYREDELPEPGDFKEQVRQLAQAAKVSTKDWGNYGDLPRAEDWHGMNREQMLARRVWLKAKLERKCNLPAIQAGGLVGEDFVTRYERMVVDANTVQI